MKQQELSIDLLFDNDYTWLSNVFGRLSRDWHDMFPKKNLVFSYPDVFQFLSVFIDLYCE